MATQLKASDYQHITVPGTPPQHIRIAFVDGHAKRAVDAAVSKMPAAIQAATLDDLSTRSFRALLVERNAIVERLNDVTVEWDDDTAAPELSAINAIENAINGRNAETADEAVMKLIAVAQIGAEGHEVDDVEAARAISDARRFFGVGYVHDHLRADAGYSNAPCAPVFSDEGSRDWRRKHHVHSIARRERVSYEQKVYTPAEPALDDPIQTHFDELVRVEDEALRDLLTCPAPTAAALALKLELLNDGEQWQFDQRPEIAATVAVDARRLARHGDEAIADQALLDAFAALRADTADFLAGLPGDRIADDEADRARDVHLDVVYADRAITVGGVLAKLRVAFSALASDRWAAHACIDPRRPEFVEGLRLDGFYEQMLWSAITDLAEVAGIDLAEQGA